MRAWAQIWGRAFSATECSALVSYILTHAPTDGVVGQGAGNVVDKMRASNLRWLKRHDPMLQSFFDRVSAMVTQSNAQAFGFDITGFYECQATEYLASNNGHYDWHEDNCWVPHESRNSPFDRKLSVVVQLSPKESYKGGRLELAQRNIGPEQFTEVGDVIIFPSFLRHRVSDVTEGVRHSFVTWNVGPRFR